LRRLEPNFAIIGNLPLPNEQHTLIGNHCAIVTSGKKERLTTQTAEAIQKVIQPQGVGVAIEAHHLCMMMRGVEKQHSPAVTSAMFGVFRNEEETGSEFCRCSASAQTACRQTGPNGVPSVLHCVLCGEDFDFVRNQLASLPNPCRIK
jgi:hypothetical protein